MLRIYVRKPGQLTGHAYKATKSVLAHPVKLLPYEFVRRGLISENEWLQSEEPIAQRFNIFITERKCDGRKKLARSFKYFTWRLIYENI